MKFCKKCGTLYDDKLIECPKCAGKIMDSMNVRDSVYDNHMPPGELRKQRKNSWMQLVIGVPAMIAFFYLVFTLFKYLLYK